MSAQHTTLKSAEIGIVLAEGKRLHHNLCTVFILKSANQRDLEGRVGYIAAKRLGGAVWRNRSKRVMRAAMSLADVSISGYDIVVVANQKTQVAGSREVAQALRNLFDKAQLTKGPDRTEKIAL